ACVVSVPLRGFWDVELVKIQRSYAELAEVSVPLRGFWDVEQGHHLFKEKSMNTRFRPLAGFLGCGTQM
ncbi:hypothetical protein, partial [Picosynechococcus sp. NKBG042902]|uniref:hypothetical protein n=1 Tax=Picosynechococcus sp. NKBG042902 TaxID=490193 RepID=UPI00403F9F63